jgi:hypothetical protein
VGILLLGRFSGVAGAIELGRSSISTARDRETPGQNSHSPLAADCDWFDAFKTDISGLDADPNSDTILARMVNASGYTKVSWSGGWTLPEETWYTQPFQVVSGNTSKSTVPGTWEYNDNATLAYMLPPEPIVTQGTDIETYRESAWDDGVDHHTIIYVRDEETGGYKELWEYYNLYVTRDESDNITAIAGTSYRYFDLANGENPSPGTSSTDAAGMAILPLSIRYDEVASGVIAHALRCQLNNNDIAPAFKWPARQFANAYNGATGLPYGSRLRLKQSWFDTNADTALGVGTQARVIGEAFRKYGLIVSDGTGFNNIELQGVSDSRWDNDLYTTFRDNVPVSAYEVVNTAPGVVVSGPSELSVDEEGEWTFTLTPDPGGAGYEYVNIYTEHLASVEKVWWCWFGDEEPFSSPTVANYTFTSPGVYWFSGQKRWTYGDGTTTIPYYWVVTVT